MWAAGGDGGGAHADSQLAHELFRLKQVEVIQAQFAAARGTPAEQLWKAQLILAQWNDNQNAAEVAPEYVTAVTGYLESQRIGGTIDGAWALDHGQFILSKLSQPIITRMEYWANNGKDRAALAPLAALATRLIDQAGNSLDLSMKKLEGAKPFDEGAYMRAYGAEAETRYYAAWALYFKAMAMDPTDVVRRAVLAEAVGALNEWAVDEPDNGVNFQAYLLRGKAYSESQEFSKAIADFAKARNDRAPNWVQFQARYQTIVANLRTRDYKLADSNLATFKRWIPKENLEAQLSVEMLGYRVQWAIAGSKTNPQEKKQAQADAVAILSRVIQRDPRFRDLVYEQLASQIPDNADLAGLLPLQQVALAHFDSQQSGGQKAETPESRRQLKLAVDAALAALANPAATNSDKVEATFLAGACNAVLNNLPEAAKYEVKFAEMAPGDSRAKPMVELALQHIGELRKIAGGTATPGAAGAAGGGALSPELIDLAAQALHLAVDVFGEVRWKYAQARMYEEVGKLPEAAAIYQAIPAGDENFLDAKYRLVTLATERFSKLPEKTPAEQMHAAAENVFATCTSFVALLDNPPASAPKDVLERAKAYRYDIWIIEAATALNPAVKQPDVAIDRLQKLEDAKAQLTETQKGAVLRYRVQAYQMAGQDEKALEVLQEYAASSGQDAMAVIRSMALSTVEEINRVEPTDPAEAKRLAIYVVKLLDPMIKQAGVEGKKDSVFEFRLIQAEMMVRAGQYKEAQALAITLQQEKPEDLRGFLAEARGMFAEAQATGDANVYAKAQDYFTRILQRLSPGTESYWEAWLRIIESMDARGGVGSEAEIKRALGDLKGVYGTKFGGEAFKNDFDRLASKYGV